MFKSEKQYLDGSAKMADHVKKYIGHFLGLMQVCAAEQ